MRTPWSFGGYGALFRSVADGRHAGQVAADVRLAKDIDTSLPEGIPDQTVRTVTENSRTRRFTNHELESEWSGARSRCDDRQLEEST